MSSLDLISNLRSKRQSIETGGNKNARERLALLFDQGGFVEIDAFFGSADAPSEGVVCGYGSVDGRLVYAYAQDSGVLNGAIGEVHANKICRLMDMAAKNGAPVISLIDCGGVRVDAGAAALAALSKIITKTVELSGVVLQISVIMGPCGGGNAIAAQSTDFVFATEKAVMFLNGSQVILGAEGKEPDLSAKTIAEKAGTIDFVYSDDNSCIEGVKKLLSYLPSNNLEDAPSVAPTDEINRLSENLTALSDSLSDVKLVIKEIADNAEFFEVAQTHAANIVTGFIRLDGYTVGVVANQSTADSVLDTKAAVKAAGFVRFCDCFDIPLVTFIDVAGFAASSSEEYWGIAKNMSKLAFAYADASVPKVNLIMNKAYTSAYSIMGNNADITLAWPTAVIAPMNPEGAAVMLYNDEISASANPVAERAAMTEKYIQTDASPYAAASNGYIDDIIEPDSTRPRLISALDSLASKRDNKLSKVFGNIPM